MLTDPALEALFVPFAEGELRWPGDDVLFLRARGGPRLREFARPGWTCQQSSKPFADALVRDGCAVGEPDAGDRYRLVLILPSRQRDEARALFARGLRHLAPGGTLVASMANAEGARTGQGDLERLAGPVRSLSKHKCRVFWATPEPGSVNVDSLEAWGELDAVRLIAEGRYLSRPGLFAWDRIDAASALLAESLPSSLSGRVADLGAGYGYLAVQLIEHCTGITALDLYEAEGRALDPARHNTAQALARCGRGVDVAVHWHDVTTGLPRHDYDVIVSNPPFHQGRADQPQLGQAFIESAADALRPGGSLWLVANRHLPYEATLARRFGDVRVVATRDGYKVIEARRPCR